MTNFWIATSCIQTFTKAFLTENEFTSGHFMVGYRQGWYTSVIPYSTKIPKQYLMNKFSRSLLMQWSHCVQSQSMVFSDDWVISRESVSSRMRSYIKAAQTAFAIFKRGRYCQDGLRAFAYFVMYVCVLSLNTFEYVYRCEKKTVKSMCLHIITAV